MQVIKENNELRVTPNLPEFRDALSAIVSMRSTDQLVTYALRRSGYGNDGWSVTYSEDQEEFDKKVDFIPKGKIQICCVGSGHESGPQIAEQDYINILAKVCEIKGMTSRAQLLYRFMKEPGITQDLLEASPKRCNERWKKLVPFLLKYGWRVSGEKIEFIGTNLFFSIDHCTSDLDVLYRETERLIADNPSARNEFIEHQQSILSALVDLFEHESKLKI